ncbi:MAG: sugar phosphate nucleotidyltransferase [Brevinemataceae bacterium]
MKAVILAGGKGTRLWPISKKDTPKQILSPLGGNRNLLETAVERTESIGFQSKDIYLLTSENQQHLLSPYWKKGLGEIISEPSARNTGPAILLACKYFMETSKDFHESIYFFASDHVIRDLNIDFSLRMDDMILCFRIIPTRADSNYGYIQAHTGGITRKVRLFKEKPDQATANLWYQSWKNNPEGPQEEKYFWNSGIYGLTLHSLSSALQKIDPSLYEFWFNSSYEEFRKNYDRLPQIPFDCMIAEKAYNLHSVPLNASSWNDIGSWESIHKALRNNPSDNIIIGSGTVITTEQTKGCLISCDQNYTIACAGVENLAVIICGNKILIADKNNASSIQELISKLDPNQFE